MCKSLRFHPRPRKNKKPLYFSMGKVLADKVAGDAELRLDALGPEKWKNDEQQDKKIQGGCKSGSGAAREMRRGHGHGGAWVCLLCLFSIVCIGICRG